MWYNIKDGGEWPPPNNPGDIMPRLRAINFESFDNSECERMTKDLLLKYPRGPLQRQRKQDYAVPSTEYRFNEYRADVYLSRLEKERGDYVTAEDFGYTAEQVWKYFNTLFHGRRPSEWDISCQLRSWNPEWSQHKCTRSSKRLWKRVGHSYWHYVKNEMKGERLFTFRGVTPGTGTGYGQRGDTVSISVAGSTKEEAQAQAQAVFGFVVQDGSLYDSNSEDWKTSNDSNAVAKNQQSLQQIGRRMAQYEQEIEALRTKLSQLEMAKEAIEMYNITVFAD